MLSQLKSLLSNNVAPGGAVTHFAPFSFSWFNTIKSPDVTVDLPIERNREIRQLRIDIAHEVLYLGMIAKRASRK